MSKRSVVAQLRFFDTSVLVKKKMVDAGTALLGSGQFSADITE